MNRRNFLRGAASAALLVTAGQAMAFDILGRKEKKKTVFNFNLTEEEWRARLTPEQYRVLRKAGTERAGSSPLNDEKRSGSYVCAACDHPLFRSEHKFDSGTGWPSFYQPANEKALGYSKDFVLFYPRTEEHCANCGGHLGHVFDDGPPPTGKRHCINGVALKFIPDA